MFRVSVPYARSAGAARPRQLRGHVERRRGRAAGSPADYSVRRLRIANTTPAPTAAVTAAAAPSAPAGSCEPVEAGAPLTPPVVDPVVPAPPVVPDEPPEPPEPEPDSPFPSGSCASSPSATDRGSFAALSGGERARVALARVLAQRAPPLLLDEPTAALDLRHQELVLRVCRERAHAGDAVVVVLHNLALAAAYAHRVAILCAGRVAAHGRPADVFTDGLLTDVYRQPVEVVPHPRTGAALITSKRDA
ncbi:ATP-binding cassette domain-containing protein [Streptomyces sp. NPDC005046]